MVKNHLRFLWKLVPVWWTLKFSGWHNIKDVMAGISRRMAVLKKCGYHQAITNMALLEFQNQFFWIHNLNVTNWKIDSNLSCQYFFQNINSSKYPEEKEFKSLNLDFDFYPCRFMKIVFGLILTKAVKLNLVFYFWNLVRKSLKCFRVFRIGSGFWHIFFFVRHFH